MDRLRTRIARWWLLTGLVAWCAGLMAQQVHELVVAHAVCAEHGEVIERGHADNTVASADVWRTADPHDGAHGCAFEHALLAAPLAMPVLPPVGHAALLQQAWVPGTQGPRGPPLAYAPKTSPPTT